MAKKKKKISSTQKLMGPVLAFLSVLLLTVAALIIMSAGSYIRQGAGYKQFTRDLQKGSLTKSTENINALYTTLPFETLMASVDPMFISSTMADSVVVHACSDILQLLEKEQWWSASLGYFSKTKVYLSNLLGSDNVDSDLKSQIHELNRSFENFRETVQYFNENLAEAPERREQLARKLRVQFVLMVDLVQRTANLFNLYAVVYSEDDLDSQRFYTAGVLQGLPKLQGLEDDLKDLSSLKAALDEAGGKVAISGANVVRVFQDQLAELKDAANIFSSNVSGFQTERKQLEEEYKDYQAKIKKQSSSLSVQLKDLLLLLTRPTYDPRIEKLLSVIIPRDLLAKDAVFASTDDSDINK